MKLRNKKTGEIATDKQIDYYAEKYLRIRGNTYNSLAELNEDWEDYKEPKKHHYYIEPRGQVIELVFGDDVDELKEELSEIGNYFETREEAEKAVKKLKAWKRLKDKGFRFKTWGWENSSDNEYTIYFTLDSKAKDTFDLDLLFGGEE